MSDATTARKAVRPAGHRESGKPARQGWHHCRQPSVSVPGDSRISFRAYLRENAPEFTPLEPLVNLEESRIAYLATQDMIATHPDLVGLYVCGGRRARSLARATRRAPRAGNRLQRTDPGNPSRPDRRGADRGHLNAGRAARRARAGGDVRGDHRAAGGDPEPDFRPLRALSAHEHLIRAAARHLANSAISARYRACLVAGPLGRLEGKMFFWNVYSALDYFWNVCYTKGCRPQRDAQPVRGLPRQTTRGADALWAGISRTKRRGRAPL